VRLLDQRRSALRDRCLVDDSPVCEDAKMKLAATTVRDANLTQLELAGLDAALNVADGHARQHLSSGQQQIIEHLPTLFARAASQPVAELQRAAHSAFFQVFGQHDHPTQPDRVLSCYSSSVAMEILARSLVREVHTVALLHPTFDNIPDILTGVGLRLLPLEEDVLAEGDLDRAIPPTVGCVFATTPNNPTGRVLPQRRLRELADLCLARNLVLTLDTSFRGFDVRAHYDHYAILEASRCRYVVIEDTGKLWPTLDLKVGLLVSSANVGLPLTLVYSDLLLGVSPLILVMVEHFARDAAAGGLDELHGHIRRNRELLRETLTGVPAVIFPDTDSRVSVERLECGGWTGSEVWEVMRARNVHVLPGRQFYWADPARGERFIRVALARPHETVAAAARELRRVLSP
jgi:enduracididine biosynthesis enzyme MppP